MDFKSPHTIPQDLLLIQDLVGLPSDLKSPISADTADDSIDSSGSEDNEDASEDEIEAYLMPANGADEFHGKTAHVSPFSLVSLSYVAEQSNFVVQLRV